MKKLVLIIEITNKNQKQEYQHKTLYKQNKVYIKTMSYTQINLLQQHGKSFVFTQVLLKTKYLFQTMSKKKKKFESLISKYTSINQNPLNTLHKQQNLLTTCTVANWDSYIFNLVTKEIN